MLLHHTSNQSTREVLGDFAMAESFFSTLEAELLSRHRFASQAEAKMACFSYIEGWYNLRRLRIFGQQDKLRADRSKGRET
jgi:transposase InsO family protein